MARTSSDHPTEGELEILHVLWEGGPLEQGPIREALQRKRAVATTTIATMLKVMLEKGLVERSDGPKGYVWSAKLTQSAARTGMLGKLIDAVFGGSAHRLVAHMLEEGKLSDQDRQTIRRLLESAPPDSEPPNSPRKPAKRKPSP